jgi:3-oxoacyl-[acyl-carrier protein] reductase
MEKPSSGYDLDGKNAFVTGTSKGLGEQIGRRLLEKGVHVIGNSRSEPPESFADYITSGAADYELGDLAQNSQQIIENIYEKHGGYEIFVNNAGAFSPDYFSRLEPDVIAREINLDLVVPLLLHRGWFGLYDKLLDDARKPELSVNICSISSFYAWPGGTAYQAAKSGLSAALSGLRSMEGYIRDQASAADKEVLGAAAELSPRIVAIYPDNVDTGLLSRSQQDALYKVKGDLLPTDIVTDTVIKAIEGKGKFGEYDDIAILVNPKDPGTRKELRGVYLAFLPLDDETHRPDFGARQLEQIADTDVLVKGGN